MLWGVEDTVIERFGAAGISKENIGFTRETFVFEAPFSPEEFLNRFRTYYGPTMNAYEAAEKEGKMEDLQSELETLFKAKNQSADANSMSIPATFLKVTVQC